jgi:tRNA(Arg) A34 adenosine deaminase TadA
MDLPGFTIQLPPWVGNFIGDSPLMFQSVEERMRFVIRLARHNVERRTGGPFGAGVFDREGRLVAPGVNIVMSSNCSVLHAEIVALVLAQSKLGSYDIGDGGKDYYELVTSTEPCAMCLGAIPWSGVSGLICGARDEDARNIGFDEGPKRQDWILTLQERGIQVIRDVLREEAASVLQYYAETGGLIYNT